MDLFLENSRLGISEHLWETIFLEFVFVEVESSGLEPVMLEKERQF